MYATNPQNPEIRNFKEEKSMKKRILSLVLTLALVMGMVVLPAAAIPEATETRPSATYEADVWYEAHNAQQLLAYLPTVRPPTARASTGRKTSERPWASG